MFSSHSGPAPVYAHPGVIPSASRSTGSGPRVAGVPIGRVGGRGRDRYPVSHAFYCELLIFHFAVVLATHLAAGACLHKQVRLDTISNRKHRKSSAKERYVNASFLPGYCRTYFCRYRLRKVSSTVRANLTVSGPSSFHSSHVLTIASL